MKDPFFGFLVGVLGGLFAFLTVTFLLFFFVPRFLEGGGDLAIALGVFLVVVVDFALVVDDVFFLLREGRGLRIVSGSGLYLSGFFLSRMVRSAAPIVVVGGVDS